MNRLQRWETGTAVAAFALAIAAGLYFVISLLTAHEVCYGMRASRMQCESFSLQTAERLLVVMGTVLVLYGGCLAGAWFQTRAHESSARNASYGLLLGCALTVLGMVVPAMGGAGFFLVPSTALVLISSVLATIVFLRAPSADAETLRQPEILEVSAEHTQQEHA